MNKSLQLYIDNAQLKKQPVNLVRNAGEATLHIYDVISADWGVSAAMVIDAITKAAGVPILNIRISSPGGDVFEARAIIEAIKRFEGKTIAHIDSLAASAATSIAIAADEVRMAEGAFFMIHNASGMAWGDKAAMRETADLLEKVEGSIIVDYVGKTGKETAEIAAWMEAETWFTAAEAIANGFVDSLSETAKTKNTWNLAAYGNAPAALLEQEQKPVEQTAVVSTMAATNKNRLRLTEAL